MRFSRSPDSGPDALDVGPSDADVAAMGDEEYTGYLRGKTLE